MNGRKTSSGNHAGHHPCRQPSMPNTRGQEAQGHRAGVAEENARRRPVGQQKRECRGRQRKQRRRTVASRPESSQRIGAESDDGHRAGKAIAAIHEVVQIGHPDDRDGHGRGNDQIGHRSRQPQPGDRRRQLHEQSQQRRYAATVVEKRNDDDRGERKEPWLRARKPDNAGAPAEPDGQPAATRDDATMQ